MARTAGTRTSRISNLTPTGIYETSSDFDGGNFEDPNDLSDVARLNVDIGVDIGGSPGTPPRRSPMGSIDLGKGLELEKPRPPRSGIGVEIGKSPAGNLGIGVEIPLPVPAPISGRGGVSIDPRTGGIRGGYGGLGIGKGPIGGSIDVGVDTPPGSDKLGCFKYVTVSLGPFSHTYGKNECEPKGSLPTPTPTPTPITGGFDPNNLNPIDSGLPDSDDLAWVIVTEKNYAYRWFPGSIYWDSWAQAERAVVNRTELTKGLTAIPRRAPFDVIMYVTDSYSNNSTEQITPTRLSSVFTYVIPNNFSQTVSCSIAINTNNSSQAAYCGKLKDIKKYIQTAQQFKIDFLKFLPQSGLNYNNNLISQIFVTEVILLNKVSRHSYSPPIPNPQPRKKMQDDCCKMVLALQLETLRLLGRPVGSNGLAPMTGAAGSLGEKFKRIETPIKDGKNPKTIEIAFPTVYAMLAYAIRQANDLDTALDPKSYTIPTGYIPNPKYSRDSEHSLKNNQQPDKDKAGNDRELEINDSGQAKMGGFLEQQQYMFNALKRLEYLFPFGELSDAFIAKDLLIPGATGDIKVHNMIMAYEIQMQYLNAAIGNPREILTIKDANPALAGDQPVEVKALSLSDWIRQIIKFQIDTGGDVDAAVNLILRDFRTNLANRTDIIKTAEMTQALFEDSGMREQQDYIPVHLEGDPYAGQWVKGQGFQANPDLEKKTEEATEKVLRETMKPTEIKLKVSRRHKDEKTDMRDLLRGLADFVQRLLSVPSGGDAAKSIDKLVESAKFKVQTEMALIRQNVVQAAAASRNRTKKRKK